MLTDDDIRGALRAGLGLWEALADDNDARAASLMPDPAQDVVGRGPGFAGRLREWLDISEADCRRMGTYWPLWELDDGDLRVLFTIADEPRSAPAGEPLVGWRWEMGRRADGEWLADPIRAHDRPQVREIHRLHPPAAPGNPSRPS